jgi:hypothetical protein
VNDIVATLPTWDEHIEMSKLGYVRTTMASDLFDCNLEVCLLQQPLPLPLPLPLLSRFFVSCRIGFAFWEATAPADWSPGLIISALYEHLGRIDDALEWSTKKVDAGTDIFVGGSQSPLVGLRCLCIKGRCLAAKDQMAEAEEALRSAAKQYGDLGWYLSEGQSNPSLRSDNFAGVNAVNTALTR